MGAPPIGLDSEFGRWDFGLGRSVYLDILMGLPQHAEGPTQLYRVLPETNGAPTGRPLVCGSKYQWAKRRVWCCRTAASQAPALVGALCKGVQLGAIEGPGRGRDWPWPDESGYGQPLAQIPACGIPALGSCLRCERRSVLRGKGA